MRTWLELRLAERLEVLEVIPGVDVAAWVRDQADAGVERILVLGGDGTFRLVATALLRMETPVGLVPVGTHNNIAAALCLPRDPYEATEVALTARAEWIAAGRIGAEVFFEGAGVGLEAELWPAGEAVLRHQFQHVLAAPLRFARTDAVDLDVELEPGEIRRTVRAFTMTISNTAMIGPHLVLAPGADIREPILHLTIYHDLTKLGMLVSAPRIRRGKQGRGYWIDRFPFTWARIKSAQGRCAVHVDGSLVGQLPVEVESIGHAVRVATPTLPPAVAARPIRAKKVAQ
jgi:diacylglycerol kinase (ATP)